MYSKRKMVGQIEQILKKKGVIPTPATAEELINKVAERLAELLPLVLDRITEVIITEELARLGRSQTCRYWHKQTCTKGIECYLLDCDRYQPQPWWHQRPGIKFGYAGEGLIIGGALFVFIAFSIALREVQLHLLFMLVLIIISRVHIVIQWRFIQRLTGVRKWV